LCISLGSCQPVNPGPSDVSGTYAYRLKTGEVEFLELGVNANGASTWKIYGPDVNGVYGDAQGIGGLEATYDLTSGTYTGLISDFFGNILGTVSGAAVTWNAQQVNSYGALPGFTLPTLVDDGATVATATQWRGHRVDETGFYYMGARYYDPEAGRFISPDPMGHGASMSLYDFANADPVNRIDPDGRCASGVNGGLEEYNLTHSYVNPNDDVSALGIINGAISFGIGAAQMAYNDFNAFASAPFYHAFSLVEGENYNTGAELGFWPRVANGAMFTLDVAPVLGAFARTLQRTAAAIEGVDLGIDAAETGGGDLMWHGSTDAVARREVSGIFVDGPGNGGLYWATSRNIDELGPGNILIGGNTNVRLFPPGLVNKGGIEATYNLTANESAMFQRAWGTDFSWNPYQWWKGVAGQYYYRDGAASVAQRFGELGKAAGITGAGVGLGWGISEWQNGN